MQSSSTTPLAASLYAEPSVDGIYLPLIWGSLETAKDVFDWSLVDPEIMAAVGHHKKISIAVYSNGHLLNTNTQLGYQTFTAPPWLFSSGVPQLNFIAGPHGGKSKCLAYQVAPPWDPTYEQAYTQFMAALAMHLHSIPGAYEAVSLVKISGINEITAETHVVAQRASQPGATCQSVTDAYPIWQGAGYGPSKILAAWKVLAAGVHAAFPDKTLTDEIIASADGAWPLIDDQGQIITTTSPTYVDLTKAIIHTGIATFPGRFTVQWDGLATNSYSQDVIDAGAAGAIIGWQTNVFLGGSEAVEPPAPPGGTLDAGAGCNGVLQGAVPCTEAEFQAILDGGLSRGGQYLEIWPPDATGFPNATKEAHARIAALP